MTERFRHWTRWLIALAKVILFALLCWFIWTQLQNSNADLSRHSWHVEPAWLVLAGIFYLMALVPSALYWRRVLLHTGQAAGLGESLRAYYISQLGKYVPGKWMVILLRRTLLHGAGIETTVVAAGIFFETFSFLAAGSVLAAVLLAIWLPDQLMLIGAALAASLMMGLPTIPSVFRWLMGVLQVGKLNPNAASRFAHIPPAMIVFGWLAMMAGWLLQGMSLWATLRAMDAPVGNLFAQLPLHTATVALSVVAGFVSQIPGGFGVRDGVSLELLKPVYGVGVATVSVIIFRLVQMVSEVAVSIILYAVGWRRSRSIAVVERELVEAYRESVGT